jgi:hypothetical protein
MTGFTTQMARSLALAPVFKTPNFASNSSAFIEPDLLFKDAWTHGTRRPIRSGNTVFLAQTVAVLYPFSTEAQKGRYRQFGVLDTAGPDSGF